MKPLAQLERDARAHPPRRSLQLQLQLEAARQLGTMLELYPFGPVVTPEHDVWARDRE